MTVDIATNHAETDGGFLGVDVVVNQSLQSRVEPDKRQLVISEIDMSRQHRLQLAAAASLPAAIDAASSEYSLWERPRNRPTWPP